MAIASRIWGVIIVIMHCPPKGFFVLHSPILHRPQQWMLACTSSLGISSVFCIYEGGPFPVVDERGCAAIRACILLRDNEWTW